MSGAGTLDSDNSDKGLARTRPSTQKSTLSGHGEFVRSIALPVVQDDKKEAALDRERFESLGRLGAGGMGEVRLVRDNDINRTIAVKHISRSESPDRVRRFVGEIRTIGQLEHPNIVPVHDAGIDADGRVFFIMKHVKGLTLKALIEGLKTGDPFLHARWTFPARARLFMGVLNAVAYAHQRGVMHRDLKPGNVMVGALGEVTVVDWGLAKPIAPVSAGDPACGPFEREGEGPIDASNLEIEDDGVLAGTPLYLSPEQVARQNSTLDHRSDIYSLGVVFHELMFLEHYLADRRSLDDVLDGVKTQMPVLQGLSGHAAQPMVPAEYGWFLSRALEKDPARRFRTVGEMRDELDRVLGGRFRVQCQRTAMKRILNDASALCDRFPKTMIVLSTLAASLALMSVVKTLLELL